MEPPDDDNRRRDRLWRGVPVAIVILSASLGLAFFYLSATHEAGPPSRYEISHTDFKALVDQGEVAEIVLRDGAVDGKLRAPGPLGLQGEAGERFTTRIPAFGDDALLPALVSQGVRLQVAEPHADGWDRAIERWIRARTRWRQQTGCSPRMSSARNSRIRPSSVSTTSRITTWRSSAVMPSPGTICTPTHGSSS
jgi:hypothetical protein